MCFIILLDDERFKQVVARWRRRCPRLASWWFGPQDPPPRYDEGTAPPQSQTKPVTKRPDSLTLPAYESYRKHKAGHIVKEVKESEKSEA
jgi:hypothetical protein